MRPVKQSKIISAQLELLDEFKIQLESLLEYTNNVTRKGNSWIEETNNETFLEINKFLSDNIFECISRCQDIANKNQECHQHSDLQEQATRDTKSKSVESLKTEKPLKFNFTEENEYKQLKEKYFQMDKILSLQSKKIRKLKQKFEKHKNETKETICKQRQESENKQKIKFDEIMEEFQQANNFMSCLQSQNEDVINQVNEHEDVINQLKELEEIINQQNNLEDVINKEKEHEDVINKVKEHEDVINKVKEHEDVINKVKEHEDVIKEYDKQMFSFIETLHNLQEQIKEHEQKSETFMKQQKSKEKSFTLRLDEVMKDILGNTESTNKLKSDSETLSNRVSEHAKNIDFIVPNLLVKLKDLESHVGAIESTCKETDKSNISKFDYIINTIAQSKVLINKMLNVSSQVDNISEELVLSKQKAFFLAQAAGAMNVQMDLSKDQIVTSFGTVLNNFGNHYNGTKGIFTAPCDGLYLCSLTLRCEIGENVACGITVNSSSGVKYIHGIAQATTINSSASVITPLSLTKNDKVYVSSIHAYAQIKLDVVSFFMCALIHKT